MVDLNRWFADATLCAKPAATINGQEVAAKLLPVGVIATGC
jgi:hypothetical protein